MSRPIILCATSPYEIALSKAAQFHAWKGLRESGSSSHSARASTLPYLIRRCEREGIPYTLKAAPGVGYCLSIKKD